ncbi:MAG: Sec-independent protein translocase protein TatC [Candidatus Eisenbacteria bacterium]|jgi:sec-independent protein translocase protein TatC
MNNPHLPIEEQEQEPRPDDAGSYDAEVESEAAEGGGAMPFLQHLEDLRKALWKSSLAIAIGMLGGWTLAPLVLEDLVMRTVKEAVVLSPFEAFNERFKLSFILGLSIALPVVFWQVWSFVVPGLLKRERTWVPMLVLSSMALFGAGAWVAYAYLVPLILHMLESFLVAGVVSQIRLTFLLEFTYNLALACGILMQMPIVAMLLTGIGLVQPMFLLRQWRMALVFIFIVTALITPGDLVSAQVVMGVPMVLLYFISVGLSFLVARRRERSDRMEGDS